MEKKGLWLKALTDVKLNKLKMPVYTLDSNPMTSSPAWSQPGIHPPAVAAPPWNRQTRPNSL